MDTRPPRQEGDPFMTAPTPTPAPQWSPSGRVKLSWPTSGDPYFRLETYDEHGRRLTQTHVTRDWHTARARAEAAELQVVAATPQARQAQRFDDLLDAYADPARHTGQKGATGNKWSPAYAARIARCIKQVLRPAIGNVPLWSLSSAHVEKALGRCRSDHQVAVVMDVLTGAISYGVEWRFLRPDQAYVLKVARPSFPTSRPSRATVELEQGETPLLLQAASVPTHPAVTALARGLQDRIVRGQTARARRCNWELLVNLLAYGGPRVSEAIALDDDCVLLGDRQRRVRIRHQLVETTDGGLLLPPKNGFARYSVLPQVTPGGYSLWDALCARAEQARGERLDGSNPRGLLFPAPRGGWFWVGNLRRSMFVPAALAAGWERQTYTETVRRTRNGIRVQEQRQRYQWRHTLHSLRHTYATTARDEWGWREAVLCANGGWASEDFVNKRYYGRTRGVHQTAAELQDRANLPLEASAVGATA